MDTKLRGFECNFSFQPTGHLCFNLDYLPLSLWYYFNYSTRGTRLCNSLANEYSRHQRKQYDSKHYFRFEITNGSLHSLKCVYIVRYIFENRD